MIAIASSRASNASRFVRSGRPMPATAFQKFPAPSPSSNRPPLITSIDAAALAIIGGSRIARLVTSGKNRSR